MNGVVVILSFTDILWQYDCSLFSLGSGDILFSPCVCLSICPSVRLSVRHKPCPLYNLKTVKDFSMKLGTLVNHDEACNAQEP